MKRTYKTCGTEFATRKAAERYAQNTANASGLHVPVYETTGQGSVMRDLRRVWFAVRVRDGAHSTRTLAKFRVQAEAEAYARGLQVAHSSWIVTIHTTVR